MMTMQVTSPAGNIVHSVRGSSGDKFDFRAKQSGIYKFCFHNPWSSPETISFYIHIGHIPNEHDLARDENCSQGDKFDFRAKQSGIYKFCFHNPWSSPETISFYIHIGHIPNEHDLARDEHMDPINVRIAQLTEALESVITEQKYLKARDSRHRYNK
ncbi:unnamed protein product [Camellia sinensis]